MQRSSLGKSLVSSSKTKWSVSAQSSKFTQMGQVMFLNKKLYSKSVIQKSSSAFQD